MDENGGTAVQERQEEVAAKRTRGSAAGKRAASATDGAGAKARGRAAAKEGGAAAAKPKLKAKAGEGARTSAKAKAGSKAEPRPKAPRAAARRGAPTRGERSAELGRRGEDAAARFLDRRGYEIVERNWTCAAGEADIIARDEEALVFVEVKTRSNTERGLPSEAVDEEKRNRYERIAALFLQGYDVVDVPVRFDVVSLVTVAPDRALIRHHINAFAAG